MKRFGNRIVVKYWRLMIGRKKRDEKYRFG